jgi:hypothetical protein
MDPVSGPAHMLIEELFGPIVVQFCYRLFYSYFLVA